MEKYFREREKLFLGFATFIVRSYKTAIVEDRPTFDSCRFASRLEHRPTVRGVRCELDSQIVVNQLTDIARADALANRALDACAD